MTYEIYRYIFIGGAALSGIMLVISMIMFFSLRIPMVIGDLSGANARKAIKRIRSYNESTGDKTHRSSPVNNERGKVTDKMTPSGRISKEPERASIGTMGTAKLRTKWQISGNLAQAPEATTLLDDSHEATTLLATEPQMVQESSAYEATTVLNAEPQVMQESDSYGAAASFEQVAVPDITDEFVIEYEITYKHTTERIV